MPGPLTNGLVFLIQVIFGIYTLILLLRILFYKLRADYYNPLIQFLLKATNLFVNPLSKIIPRGGGYDFPSLLLLLVVKILELYCFLLLAGIGGNFIGVLLWAIVSLVKLLLNVYFFAIIIQAVLSWFNTGHSPITPLINLLVEPIMRPVRRLIPPLGGVDISPLPVLIVIQLVNIILLAPLVGVAIQLLR